MNYIVLYIYACSRVEPLQLNEVAAMYMTVPYY